MELLNATPLAAAYNQGLDAEGRESLVVIAKGSFDLPLDGREARLLDEQQTLLMVDEFYGEPGLSAPRRECEFVPFKPFCDVLVLGSAQAPGGRPVQQLTAGIRVGRVSKALAVHGPRQWEPGLLGAGAGVAQPFQSQDISYASAFGGSHASPDNPGFMDCYMANPAGCGWFPRSADTAEIVGTPMPATEKLGEPVDSPTAASRRWRSARSAATGRPGSASPAATTTPGWPSASRSCPPTSTSATSSPRRPTSGPTICAAARRSCCSTSPARSARPSACRAGRSR